MSAAPPQRHPVNTDPFEVTLADRLRTLSSAGDIVATASEMLGRHLDVSRVVYAEVDESQDYFFIRRQWGQPGIPDISNETRPLAAFGPAIDEFRSGRTVVIPDAAIDARSAAEKDAYAAIGARGNIGVPIVRDGRLRVILAVHDAQPRDWTPAEVALAQFVAERTWLAVEAARAESTLRETQAWLAAMFDSLPVGVGVLDATGNVKLSNEAMGRYMPTRRLPSRDGDRRSRWQAFHRDGTPAPPNEFPGARAMRGERVVPGMEMLYTQDDGRQVWTEIAAVPIRDAAGQVSGQVVVAHDIDRLKRAEAALRRSQEKYRALFRKMDAGFCILEVLFDEQRRPIDLRYLETNPMLEQQTGLKDVVGKTLREILPGSEDFWIGKYVAISEGTEPARFERASPALGRAFDVNAFRIGDPKDHLVAVLFHDITQRRRDEEQQRRVAADLAESNRRQSEFLAVLAHELRNPLAPILTALELMRLRPDNVEAAARAREVVARQTRQMVHLIDDLLDIARVTSGKIEIRRRPMDLHAAVATAVETSLPAIDKAGHEFRQQVHDGPLPVSGDPTRLAQIVSNLLTNAAKYTPAGGTIRLTVEKDGDEAIVSVSDTGLGIPQHALGSIFEMFSQVKRQADSSPGGLGIGLALVKQLVALHGGSVGAASDGPGRGSTFTVRLPLAREAAPEWRDSAGAPLADDGRKLRILVADDNVDAAQSLGTLLSVYGHDTQVTHDGPQALQAAMASRPDVVFLDIGMPGMSGYEVARQMRATEALKDTILVAVTGWGTAEDRATARKAGFDAHFTKPVSPEEIGVFLAGVG